MASIGSWNAIVKASPSVATYDGCTTQLSTVPFPGVDLLVLCTLTVGQTMLLSAQWMVSKEMQACHGEHIAPCHDLTWQSL